MSNTLNERRLIGNAIENLQAMQDDNNVLITLALRTRSNIAATLLLLSSIEAIRLESNAHIRKSDELAAAFDEQIAFATDAAQLAQESHANTCDILWGKIANLLAQSERTTNISGETPADFNFFEHAQVPDIEYVDLTHIAAEMGCSSRTVRNRIAAGNFPKPHAVTQHGKTYRHTWVKSLADQAMTDWKNQRAA